MPAVTPETYFSSKNPIIQKCFDILKCEDARLKLIAGVIHVCTGSDTQPRFSVGDSGILFVGSISFDADKTYDDMSFKDVYKLLQRCKYLYSLGEHERVQRALEQLGLQSKQGPQPEPQESLDLFDRIRNGVRKIFTPSKNK